MRWSTFLLRFFCLLMFVVWVGGFTFYGAVVLPALHAAFGLEMTGSITQKISNPLNLIGVVTLVLFWIAAWADGPKGSPFERRARTWLLALDTVILSALILGHPVLDRVLATGDFTRFDPIHRAYLWASTLQWFVNLGVLATALRIWAS